MYPFTFPIKEYGDEVESQQGVPDTQTQSQMYLPCYAVTISTF